MPQFSPLPFSTSRRQMLAQTGAGFGALGLATAFGWGADQANPQASDTNITGGTHHRPRAKRVIFLFMNGAPSHVDTFDPKPELEKRFGQKPGESSKGRAAGFMPSPYKFAAHGKNGVVMSELFPHLSNCADDLCVLRSLHTDVPNHEPGLLMMHSGNQQPVRPSMGSWVSYGLGNENENLPRYVVLCPGQPVVGPQLWSNSFLPGEHQGMSVDTNDTRVDKLIANIRHPSLLPAQQREQLELLRQLNARHQAARPGEAMLDEQIRAMELSFKMQTEAAEAFDINREDDATKRMYGDTVFSRSCLLARRLVERGVRFVQVYYTTKSGKQPWDSHTNNNKRQKELCADSDRATAALLTDLKQRGLLEDTLVVWGGEFGRTPYAQANKKMKMIDVTKAGRDHHHTGFSMFLAGGGVKAGFTYGATDEVGMHAVENRMHVHDLHATLLHLLGIDHERLTYRYSGRDFRLTDVHGRIAHDVIA